MDWHTGTSGQPTIPTTTWTTSHTPWTSPLTCKHGYTVVHYCVFLIKCSQYSSLIRRRFSKWLTSSREISQRWQPFLFKCLCPDILRRVSGRMIIAVRSLSVFMMHWSYKKNSYSVARIKRLVWNIYHRPSQKHTQYSHHSLPQNENYDPKPI